MTIKTPWGPSQGSTKYADGIEFHTTARHGGFKLDRARNAQVHEAWRRKGGWYEEDCEAAIVIFTFSSVFIARSKGAMVEGVEASLINWYPDQYEAVTGRTIPPGTSYVRERDNFAKLHANDWVVISAAREGAMVRGIATQGGKRGEYGNTIPHRTFLIPSDEYAKRSEHGFVIDLARHEEAA